MKTKLTIARFYEKNPLIIRGDALEGRVLNDQLAALPLENKRKGVIR